MSGPSRPDGDAAPGPGPGAAGPSPRLEYCRIRIPLGLEGDPRSGVGRAALEARYAAAVAAHLAAAAEDGWRPHEAVDWQSAVRNRRLEARPRRWAGLGRGPMRYEAVCLWLARPAAAPDEGAG